MARVKALERTSIGKALRGPLTPEKRRVIEQGVSDRVKKAVRTTIERNAAALKELADH